MTKGRTGWVLRMVLGVSLEGGWWLCYSESGRGVAQFGSAPAWGAGGRWFESSLPDHERRDGKEANPRPLHSSAWRARILRYIKYLPSNRKSYSCGGTI